VADIDDARRIALSLPGVTDEGSRFRVAGKLFAWTYMESVAGRRGRVPRPDVLALRVAEEAEKHVLIAADPATFFTTAHYKGYPAVLARLPEVEEDELVELVTDAWRTRAPRGVVAAFDTQPDRQLDA
jgi:hypothetical protein